MNRRRDPGGFYLGDGCLPSFVSKNMKLVGMMQLVNALEDIITLRRSLNDIILDIFMIALCISHFLVCSCKSYKSDNTSITIEAL